MTFDPNKSKKLYQNGISHKKENKENKKIVPLDEWPILDLFGNLIGFIQLKDNSDLPNEIWIRDKKYKLSEKITKD